MAENSYQLLDSGEGQKLERFGPYLLVRPCSQALWRPSLSKGEWQRADGIFSREKGQGWTFKGRAPKSWEVVLEGIRFKLAPTDFGHLGLFPEHAQLWGRMRELLSLRPQAFVLNLFAYSGGATLAAAQTGARVCHLDASKGMVTWAKENAELNALSSAPIRWIVDDAIKFLKREVKRGALYDGILLDPPSFGRGSRQEVFKIERDIHELLDLCTALLSKNPLFLILTTHTPGMTPLVMRHLLEQKMGKKGRIEAGEMVIPSSMPLPCGSFARFEGT